MSDVDWKKMEHDFENWRAEGGPTSSIGFAQWGVGWALQHSQSQSAGESWPLELWTLDQLVRGFARHLDETEITNPTLYRLVKEARKSIAEFDRMTETKPAEASPRNTHYFNEKGECLPLPTCPRCGSSNVVALNPKLFECQDCESRWKSDVLVKLNPEYQRGYADSSKDQERRIAELEAALKGIYALDQAAPGQSHSLFIHALKIAKKAIQPQKNDEVKG